MYFFLHFLLTTNIYVLIEHVHRLVSIYYYYYYYYYYRIHFIM